MRTVYQDLDEPECGAACLAMLADISLADACLALYGHDDPKRVGRKELLAAIKKSGRKPKSGEAIRITKKNRLRDVETDALVYGVTIRSDGTESKHWLVWDHAAGALRDPLGFYRAIKVTSYTEIR